MSEPIPSSSNFLHTIQQYDIPSTRKNNTQQMISINKTRNELKNVLKYLKLLKESEDQLKDNLTTASNQEWIKKLSEINLLQQNITKSLEAYKNPSTILKLQQLTQQRKRKRLRIKKRNKLLKEQKQLAIKNRKKLHQKIDSWLKNEKEKILNSQKSEYAAKRTELVLSSVTKKKSDAMRYLNVLKSLKELRKARSSVAQSVRGGEVAFEETINRLEAVWNDALTEYDNEENDLQLLLDTKYKPIEEQWKEVLFNISSKRVSCSIPEKSFEEFLEIRRVWDSCIVPDNSPFGSCIPHGWVLPSENPSDKWKVYLK